MIKIGDNVFVECIDVNWSESKSFVGKIGTVINTRSSNGGEIGVNFQIENEVTHYLGGYLNEKTGFYLNKKCLKVMK
jgi:spore germination protein GerM